MTRALRDAVGFFGPMEWVRPVGNPARPPYFAWRFEPGNEDAEEKIVEVVSKFHGAAAWRAYKGGRNWVIIPVPVKDFFDQNDFHTDVDAADAFASRYPEMLEPLHADADALAQELRRVAIPH